MDKVFLIRLGKFISGISDVKTIRNLTDATEEELRYINQKIQDKVDSLHKKSIVEINFYEK